MAAASAFQFGATQPKTTSSATFGGGSTVFAFGSGLSGSTVLAGTTFGAAATQSGGLSAFGTTATAKAPGTSAFGGLSIMPSTSSTGFSFGAGTTAATPSANLTLGGLSAAKAATSTPLLTSLGGTTATSTATGQALGLGLGGTAFGQPAAVASSTGSGFTFGKTNAAPAATQGTSGFSLLGGQKTTAGLTLGAASATTAASGTGFTFGAKTTGSTIPTLGGLAQTVATTTPLFGGVTATATTKTTGLGFGSVTSTGGLLGRTAPTSTTSTSTGLSITGLGGAGTSTAVVGTSSASNTTNQQETTNLKDTALPGPFGEIVENIKKYVKEQKEHRDEISRFSVSCMEKVREETMTLRQTLALVSNSIQRDSCAVESLKMDVAQELKNAEIAQRTNDIPAALQHENIAPQEYFQSLVESFEDRMQGYRKQIEIVESHLASLSQSQTLTPQDLSEVMHKIHKTFIALAALLHAVHEAVKLQKEHYLNYRKAYFKDTTDIFAANYNQNGNTLRTNSEFGLGPSPFYLKNGTNVTAAPNSTNNTGTQGLGLGLAHTGGLGRTGTFGALGATATPSVGFGGQGLVTGFGGGLGASGGLGTSTGFGTSGLGTSGGIGGGLGSTAFGASTGTPFGAGSSTGFGFGTPQAGITFGGLGGTTPGTPATAGTPLKPFQLQRPPAGNKRGKKR